MLDDLRNTLNSHSEEETTRSEKYPEEKQLRPPRPFFGLTAFQRFVLSLTLFLIVVILAAFFLILFEKVTP